MTSQDNDIPKAIMDQIRRQAEEVWGDEAEMQMEEIESQVDAFQELNNIRTGKVPDSVVAELKQAAKQRYGSDYIEQVKHVKDGLWRHTYIRELRETVEPMKELLINLEDIIGRECYNANTQNYGPGGVWEGEGRSFQYPITFTVNGRDCKSREMHLFMQPEVLMTGRYKFGANELNIYWALKEVVEFLQREYGLQLTKRK